MTILYALCFLTAPEPLIARALVSDRLDLGVTRPVPPADLYRLGYLVERELVRRGAVFDPPAGCPGGPWRDAIGLFQLSRDFRRPLGVDPADMIRTYLRFSYLP